MDFCPAISDKEDYRNRILYYFSPGVLSVVASVTVYSVFVFLSYHPVAHLEQLQLGPSEIASISYISNEQGGVLGIVFN